MAGLNNPYTPPDDGKIKLPSVQAGMNRRGPTASGGGKSEDQDKWRWLGRTKSEENDADILDRARSRFQRCVDAETENRKKALNARKFKGGDQWPADIAAQRNTERRPCITVNKIPTFIHQVTNDQRMNRPTINISPVGDKGDKEAAKMYRGMIRHIERQCGADIAYDTAFDDAVTSGFGYWRIMLDWEAPDSFQQTIVIKRVRNPFTVYLDPERQEPDGSDARYGFVTEFIPVDEFKDKYGDENLSSYDLGGIGDRWREWTTKDGVRVAEYYEIQYEMRTLVELDNGATGWADELSNEVKTMLRDGRISVRRKREAEHPKVMHYKLTALKILEREEWIGEWVPIVQCIGNELDIEGKVQLTGLVHDAIGPQQMYNYWCPLSLDTPIPTPQGWSTMGLIGPGDQVFNEAGDICDVVGQSPIHINRDCYRVEFDDGSEVVADAEHRWQIERRGTRRGETFDWRTETVGTTELRPGSDFIVMAKALELPDADLPINPYLLGVWLGDGAASEPRICAGDGDMAAIRALLEARGCRLSSIQQSPNRVGVFTVYGVRKDFTALGLLGNKHIPPMYLRASREQRLELLRGLMDTDGSIGTKNSQCTFTTVDEKLSAGVAELLRSLGLKAIIHRRAPRAAKVVGGINGKRWIDQFAFTASSDDAIFALPRKLARLQSKSDHPRRTKRLAIRSVTPTNRVPVKCIAVDTPSHLFLCGEAMAPTHNTSETEVVALQPKAPYIMEEGQVEGHERQWKNANTKPYPYLLYKAVNVNGRPAPAPARQPPPQIPAGVVQAKQGAAQDMQAVTGIRFDASMNERFNDESGKAIHALQRAGDLGSFHYVDNLTRSLKFSATQVMGLINSGKVYDEERIITILREDDKEEQIKLDPNAPKAYDEKNIGPNGALMKVFNPKEGKYGVTVDIGPSYATKRIEAAESMMGFVKALPNTAALVSDLIASEMDWPGAEKIAARLAKAIPPNLIAPENKDLSPQVQAVIQNLEQQVKQLHEALNQSMAALKDKEADREIAREKIESDFEAKLIAVIQKAEAEAGKAALEEMRALAETARTMVEIMRPEPAETGQEEKDDYAGYSG